MKTKIIPLVVGGAIACFLTGCASQPLDVPPVGPSPDPHAVNLNQNLPRGYLLVYSDTETHEIGQNTYYYTHTPYNVYDASGLPFKWVQNHIGNMDESPALVRLPIGRYYIVAESSSYGRVTVPVIVKEAKRTTLHLDRGWQPPAGTPSNAVVRLPNGEPVGWNLALTR